MDLNDDEKIQQNISYFANRDIESLSFYDIINPFQWNINDIYQKVENSNDLVTVSDEHPFPVIVLNAITPFTCRIFFGAIPMLSKFYCIIDNSVYFWSENKDNDNVDFYVEENSTIISCVSCGHLNPNLFREKKCIGVILYGTDILMKIVPVTEKNILFELSIEIKLKFIPTAFYTSKAGTIYISSDEGDIYSLIVSINQNTGKIETTLKNLTRNRFLQMLPTVLFTGSQILQIAVDEEAQILASLDFNSIIKFYKINDDKMKLISKFNPADYEGDFAVSYISTIPLSSSNSTKFVGFLQNGTRIFFYVDQYLDLVIPSTKREPPPLSISENFDSAFLSPSYCIFLYENSIVIAHESPNSNELSSLTRELYCVIPIESDVLTFSQSIPNIQPTKMSNNAFFWQHLFPPNPGYLITSTGIRTINFTIPLDSLSKFFDEEEKNRVFMSPPLRKWASYNTLETAATALLLAKKFPDKKNRCLHFIMNIIQEAEAKRREIDPHYYASFSFYIRFYRILSLVWTFPLLSEKKENEYQFSEGFLNPPLNYVKEMKILKSLCDDYYKLYKNTNQPKTQDIDYFPSISKFISNIIGILRFVKIIIKIDNNTINQILAIMDIKHKNRLVLLEFGYNPQLQRTSTDIPDLFYQHTQIPQLEESFHEFAMKLYEVMPQSDVLSTIERKCPQFYDHLDIDVLNSIKIIKEKLDDSDGEITNAAKNLIRCMSRPMNLDEICLILKEKGCFKSALELCIAKADNIDPLQLALSWFHSNKSAENSLGKDEFDNRCNIYDIIIKLTDTEFDDNIDPLLNSDDEILHFCFYDYLLENRKLKKILSKKTPFLKFFIKKRIPNYLWRYLAAHRKYNESSIELWNYIINDNDLTLNKRIKLLRKGIRLSFESNTLKNEYVTLLKLAETQLELTNRIDDKDDADSLSYCIYEQYDLFIECTSRKIWDLTIRILSISSFKVEKKFPISKVWTNFLVQDLYELPLFDCTKKLHQLFSCLNLNSDVAKIDMIVPILENFKISKKGTNHWAFQLLTKIGYDITSLAEMYYKMSNDENIKKDIKCTFIDILSFALSKGAHFPKDKILTLKNWFLKNASDYNEYDTVIRNFSIFYDCAV